MLFDVDFVDRMETAMEAAGISVSELDVMLKKKPGYISTLRRKRSDLKLSSATAIASALGVKLRWLADGDGPMLEHTENPRYPNATAALELMGDKWHPFTREWIATCARYAPADLSVGEWIDDGNNMDRRFRAGDEGETLPADAVPMPKRREL